MSPSEEGQVPFHMRGSGAHYRRSAARGAPTTSSEIWLTVIRWFTDA